jgi:hypothetical protein
MTILFPLPPKPLGVADNEEVPNTPRDNMALQQYMGPLKYQKMLAWLTAMSTLTGGCDGTESCMASVCVCWGRGGEAGIHRPPKHGV